MKKIYEINKKNINQKTVKMLEDVLDNVKSGKIVGAGVVLAYNDGCTASAFSGCRITPMLGEIRIMERDMIDCHIDLRCHSAGDEY